MKIITWVKNNIILLGVILTLLLFNINQCRNNKIANKKLEVSEQNIKALNDTIRITKAKDGTLEANKLAFLADKVSSLENLSTELAKEVKKTKGNVNYIVNAGTKIVHDTTYLTSAATVDSNSVVVDFKFDSTFSKGNSRSLAGYTKYGIKDKSSFAMLTKDSLNMSFVTGIKNLDKGEPEIFIRSNYPGFAATSIEGAVLDKKLFKGKTPSKFGFGLQLGYSPLNYNFSTRKLGITNQITFGIGLNYKIL